MESCPTVKTGQAPEEEQKTEESNDKDLSQHLPNCKKCFHQKSCYAYLSILGKQEEFKCMKWVALPFAPEALATTCKEYTPKDTVVKVDKSEGK